MKRQTAALIIAVLFHLVLLLLFWITMLLAPKPAAPDTLHKQRIKVSLKERPEAKKDALIKNSVKAPETAPPMPKGGQLEKLIPPSKTQPLPTPKEQIRVEPEAAAPKSPAPKKPAETKPPRPKTARVPSEKPYIPLTRESEKKRTEEQNLSEIPEAHRGLFAKLSKKQPTVDAEAQRHDPNRREGRINQDLKELYGDTFGKLTEGEQKYLLDNQEIMRRITQEVLNRVGRVNIPNNMRINSDNIIEFYLYPNGDISEIKFIKRSGFYILDDTTKETIEYAYSRYPRPKQKTLIRYKVGYFLRGY